jgi:hypothetical protein
LQYLGFGRGSPRPPDSVDFIYPGPIGIERVLEHETRYIDGNIVEVASNPEVFGPKNRLQIKSE